MFFSFIQFNLKNFGVQEACQPVSGFVVALEKVNYEKQNDSTTKLTIHVKPNPKEGKLQCERKVFDFPY